MRRKRFSTVKYREDIPCNVDDILRLEIYTSFGVEFIRLRLIRNAPQASEYSSERVVHFQLSLFGTINSLIQAHQ
jgi:hypothetical protein